VRAVTYQSVQDAFTSLVGVDALLTAEQTNFRRSFVSHYRDGWYAALWPFTLSSTDLAYDGYGQLDLTAITDLADLLRIFKYDPQKTKSVTEYGFRREGTKATIKYHRTTGSATSADTSAGDGTTVVVKYRKQEPIFIGTDYSGSATYAVGDVIYFDTLDWYKCIDATSAGQSPTTHAAKWTKQEVAYDLSKFTQYRCYVDWLMADGQHSKAEQAMMFADKFLFDSMDRLERQSNQSENTNVKLYPAALTEGSVVL